MAFSFRPGIRTEIVFTLTVLMAGAVALVGVLFLKVEERSLLQQKVRGGRQMMAALQQFLQEGEPESSPVRGTSSLPADLERVIKLFFQGQPLFRFSVIDRQFRVVADSREERIGRFLRDENLEKAIATGKILAQGNGEAASVALMKKAPILFSAPITSRGETIGAIRGELALDDAQEMHSRSQATVFLYILFDAFLLIVVGSFLLSRVIINPLKKLVRMSAKIAEGDLTSLAEPTGADEVGILFSSFNHMASRLREDRAKMEEYIGSLEKINRELRRAQDEIIRQEKFASIGRLAASVAHEVGNPTGAILGYLDLLTKGKAWPDEDQEILQRVTIEAERIRRIIRELLDYSRPSLGRMEEVDVNGVILNTLSLLAHQKKVWEKIRVVAELQKDLPRWPGDPHQLQQVMINLFLNAADVMVSSPGEKKLRIATRVTEAEGTGEKKGNNGTPAQIEVEVEDSGPGIAAEHLSRIFDPFYSTKPAGEGTGLGLAICTRILESYGGRILVRSEEGKGATFILLLPVGREDATARPSGPRA